MTDGMEVVRVLIRNILKNHCPRGAYLPLRETDVIKVDSTEPADSLDVREDEQVFPEHLLHVRHWEAALHETEPVLPFPDGKPESL